MKKPFRFLALLMVPALAITMSALLAACGGDEEETVTANLVSADPPSGSEVAEGAVINLVFDNDPGTLTASAGTVGGSGKNRTVTADAAEIVLTWDNGGTATLTYTLLPPDTDPPVLESSEPADGASDVEPADVTEIVLTFNEDIAKANVQLASEGTPLGWLAKVEGNVVKLQVKPGAELVNEKTYEVTGEVEDGSGNKTEVKISFTTKAKQ